MSAPFRWWIWSKRCRVKVLLLWIQKMRIAIGHHFLGGYEIVLLRYTVWDGSRTPHIDGITLIAGSFPYKYWCLPLRENSFKPWFSWHYLMMNGTRLYFGMFRPIVCCSLLGIWYHGSGRSSVSGRDVGLLDISLSQLLFSRSFFVWIAVLGQC